MKSASNGTRRRACLVSRAVICLVVAGSIGSLLWTPGGIVLQGLDILVRTYLVFLGTVMAHEGVHGHLGRTRRANFFWGRIALIPGLVPFTNFRRTHRLHHSHTNDPERDPDYFMKPRHPIEIPFRALAMPHQWYFWLKRRDLLDRNHRTDLLLNYAAIVAVYGAVAWAVGPARLATGVLPVLVLVSVLLWYPFALKTHEGHSTGPSETRSHDYYGRLMYWLSLGLSMHRVHHLKPHLTWVDLLGFVEPAPAGTWGGLIPRRDIRLAEEDEGSPAASRRRPAARGARPAPARRTAILIATGLVPLLVGCSDPGGSYRPLTLSMRITYVDPAGPRFVFSPIPLSIGQQRKLYVEASTFSYLGGKTHSGSVRCESLAWTTESPDLASVTENGVIKGLKQGATTVRVRADCGATYGERVAERDVEIGDASSIESR